VSSNSAATPSTMPMSSSSPGSSSTHPRPPSREVARRRTIYHDPLASPWHPRWAPCPPCIARESPAAAPFARGRNPSVAGSQSVGCMPVPWARVLSPRGPSACTFETHLPRARDRSWAGLRSIRRIWPKQQGFGPFVFFLFISLHSCMFECCSFLFIKNSPGFQMAWFKFLQVYKQIPEHLHLHACGFLLWFCTNNYFAEMFQFQ
jgi:hypothetical protein